MKIINRFLLRHFLRILSLSSGAFVGIYLLIDFLEKIGSFIDSKASAGDYLSYLFNNIPVIFVQILPLAILMTVVLTLGTLGRTNEITAMRACGVSLWRIVQPFMLLAVGTSLLLLCLNEFVVPLNTKAINELLEIRLKGKKQLTLSRDEIWYRDSERIINVLLAEPAKQKLYGITIFHVDDNSRIYQRLESPLFKYRDGEWFAEEVTVRTFDPLNGDLLRTEVKHDQIMAAARNPEDFALNENHNNELNFRQLSKTVNKLEQQGLDPTRHRVDMHNRLAAPFTCLIMAFLGVPFALQRGRNSNIAIGIGLSLGIGVLYFILQSLVTAFGYSGALPPMLTAWTTNIIFLMLGVWLLLSVKQ